MCAAARTTCARGAPTTATAPCAATRAATAPCRGVHGAVQGPERRGVQGADRQRRRARPRGDRGGARRLRRKGCRCRRLCLRRRPTATPAPATRRWLSTARRRAACSRASSSGTASSSRAGAPALPRLATTSSGPTSWSAAPSRWTSNPQSSRCRRLQPERVCFGDVRAQHQRRELEGERARRSAQPQRPATGWCGGDAALSGTCTCGNQNNWWAYCAAWAAGATDHRACT